jgi:hypothetical protein
MWFMLSLVKESSQNALERFFLKIKEAVHTSQQAFSQARQKVKGGSYNEPLKDWRGYLPMAVDGSHIALPPEAALREYYGAAGHELSAATACGSVLYDRESDIIVDAKLEPLMKDERGLYLSVLVPFVPNDYSCLAECFFTRY